MKGRYCLLLLMAKTAKQGAEMMKYRGCYVII